MESSDARVFAATRVKAGSMCQLCKAVQNATGPQVRLENELLGESAHFVILPAVGPLATGHVMAISRSHFDRLSDMPAPALTDYETLRSKAVDFLDTKSLNLLEVEHGSDPRNYAGGCIVHTHIHWFPGLASCSGLFLSALPTVRELSSLEEIRNISEPYLMVRENLMHSLKVYDATGMQSQFSRRLIAANLGIEVWDWALYSAQASLPPTIGLWRGFAGFGNDGIQS